MVVDGGKILEVDHHPPRVWFGVHYRQIQEITCFCWFDLFSPADSAPSSSEDHISDENLFLINTIDPWYGDIIVYLQTSTFRSELTKDARCRIRHQSQPYLILGDTLYRVGVDSVLHRCLTLEEDVKVLNDCHSGTCVGHMSDYATT